MAQAIGFGRPVLVRVGLAQASRHGEVNGRSCRDFQRRSGARQSESWDGWHISPVLAQTPALG